MSRLVFPHAPAAPVTGGRTADNLLGDTGPDTLTGNGGADTLNGAADNDILYGGLDNDRLILAEGSDTAYGGLGDDTFAMSANGLEQVLHGGNGSDLLLIVSGLTGPVIVSGNLSTGATLTVGGVLQATIDGVERLELFSGAGNDILLGGAGNDRLISGAGTDFIASGGGADAVFFDLGGLDTVQGQGGNDTISAILQAGLGSVGSGVALVDGGAGSDLLTLYAREVGFLFDGSAQFVNGVKVAEYSGFERLESRGSFGDDSVTGLAGNDTLSGGSNGNDVLTGLGGDDILDGGLADDLLLGGDGNDAFTVTTGRDTADGGAGDDFFYFGMDFQIDHISGGSGNDSVRLAFDFHLQPFLMVGDLQTGATITFAGTVQTQFEGIESLSIVGSSVADVLIGGIGADSIRGEAGNDTISTGDGDDIVEKHVTNGVSFAIDAGDGTDTIVLTNLATGNAEMVLSDVMQVQIQGLVVGTVIGAEIAEFDGGFGDDLLVGGALNDRLSDGDGGADTLRGMGGNDDIFLEPIGGRDVVTGDAGIDTLHFYAQGPGAPGAGITMSLNASGLISVKAAGNEILAARGIERLDIMATLFDDKVRGLSRADTLFTLDGDDTILAGAGDDRIDSGDGNDLISGGSGADKFEFNILVDGESDTITDFSVNDTLRIERFWFGDSRALVVGSDPVPVTGSTRGVLLYDTDTGLLSIDRDGDGGNAAVAFVTLLNQGTAATLTAAQIQFLF